MSGMVVQVGRGIARAGRVDLDRGLAQIICQVDSEHIERCLRGIVGKNLGVIVRSILIAVDCDRTQSAGHIHNTRTLCSTQQRQQRLCECHCAEEVRFESASQRFDADIACVPIALFENSCVIHEHIQMPELCADLPCKFCSACGSAMQVCGDEAYIEPLFS